MTSLDTEVAASTVADLERTLRSHLLNSSTSFSIGGFGAVAEFFRQPDEPFFQTSSDPLSLHTARGAIRIVLSEVMRPIAYESLSRRAQRWLHGLVVCMPTSSGRGHERQVVTEIGADTQAIRDRDRNDITFDLGLGLANIDFCIRTGDRALIRLMRTLLGKSFFDADSHLVHQIISAEPHRMVCSRAGRIEIYQAIGKEKTPEGPHTHLLPRLLKSRRTHDANVPVPAHYLPVISLYPSNPNFDHLGQLRDYDPESHAAFEPLLERWGPADYVLRKRRVNDAVLRDLSPDEIEPATSRLQRAATRIALRQLNCRQQGSKSMSAWRRAYDHD